MSHERRQVIVVDDEPDLAALFCDGLQSVGFKTKAFDDPEAAIEYISTHDSQVGLVITDLKMPEMDGKEIIKLISQMDNDIKLMLISAYDLDLNELRQI
jgi:two-component system, cell cycle sensor histidine kinase and response regulator CckA